MSRKAEGLKKERDATNIATKFVPQHAHAHPISGHRIEGKGCHDSPRSPI